MNPTYFSGLNILLVSPEGWDHLWVSKHHYAIALAKHNKVWFLNPPGNEFRVQPTAIPNLHEIYHRPFMKGLRFLPKSIQRNQMKERFDKIESLCQVHFDLIWSFDNSVFYDFNSLPGSLLKILQLVDFSQDFQFGTAAASADICLAISENILQKLKKHNPNSFRIPHGVQPLPRGASVTLPGTNKIKALYAGNLDMNYIDWDLAEKLIVRYPSVDFIFLGPYKKKYVDHPHVFFLGRIEKSLLIDYFSVADILMTLYKSIVHPEQLTNAHKVLEYLLSGKVMVSTFLSDYSGTGLFPMGHTHEEYMSHFENVIQNLNEFNAIKRQEERIAYANGNTYEIRLEEIGRIVADCRMAKKTGPV